jgi:phosphoribosylglycinamide formyltransferase-1
MKNLVIFASGAGTNAQNIMKYFQNDTGVKVRLVISNNPRAGVLKIAEQAGIPTLVIDKHTLYETTEVLDLLTALPADLIVLAGFLWKVPDALVSAFSGRIINIHPALLPKYGGKGMYGMRVHEAVISSGDQQSGITIHFVNEKYDEGEMILQKQCPVTPEDTPGSLAQKVHQLEYRWYPETIAKLLFTKKKV